MVDTTQAGNRPRASDEVIVFTRGVLDTVKAFEELLSRDYTFEEASSILNAIAQGYLSLKLPSPLASSHPFLTQYKDLPVQAKAQVQVDFPILKKLELEPARRSSRNLVKKSERKKLGSSTNQPEKAAAVKRAAIKHGKGKGGSSRKRKHELVIEKLDVNERESRDLSCELSDDSEEESDDNDELIVTSSLGETRGGGREEELKREARGLAEAEVGLNHQSKSLKKAPIENVLQLFSQFCQLGPRGRADATVSLLKGLDTPRMPSSTEASMDVSTKLEMMDSDGFAQVRRILSQLGENSRELMNQGELLELLILYLRGRVAVITAGRAMATDPGFKPKFRHSEVSARWLATLVHCCGSIFSILLFFQTDLAKSAKGFEELGTSGTSILSVLFLAGSHELREARSADISEGQKALLKIGPLIFASSLFYLEESLLSKSQRPKNVRLPEALESKPLLPLGAGSLVVGGLEVSYPSNVEVAKLVRSQSSTRLFQSGEDIPREFVQGIGARRHAGKGSLKDLLSSPKQVPMDLEWISFGEECKLTLEMRNSIRNEVELAMQKFRDQKMEASKVGEFGS